MGKLTLVFGNKNYSSWSLRPWILLKQFNLPFEEKRIALFTEITDQQLEPYDSDFKVPVLIDDELVIWDSLSIMEYLSEQYLDGRGWPIDRQARSAARSISAEMHSSFSALRSKLPMNCRKHFAGFSLDADVQREIERISHLWTVNHKRYGQGGAWLFGDYSIADAMYAPVVLRLIGYDVPLKGYAAEYVQLTMQTQAIQQWVEAGRQETEVIEMDEI